MILCSVCDTGVWGHVEREGGGPWLLEDPEVPTDRKSGNGFKVTGWGAGGRDRQ